MNKKEIKYLIPIMQAFVDGKTIQYYNGMKWIDLTGNQCSFQFPAMFRIKPKEPTYRPFGNAEECWAEMQKHEPFGWVISKKYNTRHFITKVETDGSVIISYEDNRTKKGAFDDFTFADGTPFGVKEEE